MGSNHQVIIIHSREDNLSAIESGLIHLGIEKIQKVLIGELSSQEKINKADLIIFKCDSVSEKIMLNLIQFANKHPRSKVLVIAQQISLSAYKQVGMMKNIFTLQEPFEINIYENLVTDLIEYKKLDLIQFPRFVTNEPARILVMETGLFIPTRMRNYSTGGAFFEYKGISLRVGHNLNLNLLNHQTSTQTKERLQIKAKVVWVRNGESSLSADRGVGVQFNEI